MEKEKKKKIEKEWGEFKKFLMRGNVLDLAVGVIVGGAFGKIVSSLVNDILMPLIGILLGGLDFSNLTIKINDATIQYGTFIQNIIDFLIIAVCVYVIVRIVNSLTSKKEEKKEEPKQKSEEVIVLEEIRNLLKEEKKDVKQPKKRTKKKENA